MKFRTGAVMRRYKPRPIRSPSDDGPNKIATEKLAAERPPKMTVGSQAILDLIHTHPRKGDTTIRSEAVKNDAMATHPIGSTILEGC